MSSTPSPSNASPTQETLATLSLHLINGIGPRIHQALRTEFESSTETLVASFERLTKVPGVGPTLARQIRGSDTVRAAQQEWQACRESKIQIVDRSNPAYPTLLNEIPDPPLVLYAKGRLQIADETCVAIVGTRRASSYGKQQAERLAFGLAQAGITVVSGLARGIDAAAHRGALQANGRTVAVLASGLDEIYPPEHDNLAEHIVQHGALLTEASLYARPRRGMFPRRNRIISGLCRGVIVVEAAGRSGALVTVRHAVDQNREVFAVPGRVDDEGSRGCHRLIRDGAKLVECVEDVLEELGPHTEVRLPNTVASTSVVAGDEIDPQLSDLERLVLNQVGRDVTDVDQVIEDCLAQSTETTVSRVLSALSILEMRRLIDRQSGNLVVRR